MAIWPFKKSRAEADAERLLAQVTGASRRPELYGQDRAPDTLEGRFEMLTVHAALALIRLRKDEAAEPLAQAFTDQFFKVLDSGLREAGVGDTAVPKRMHKMAGAFYGRLTAYAEALQDRPELEAALSRNVWRMESHPFAPELARRMTRLATAQAEAPVEALFDTAVWSRD